MNSRVGQAIAGVDFTSRPTRRKPIAIACGRVSEGGVQLESVASCVDFDGFATWLRTPGPWLAAFDLPFGLPRELVLALGWPTEWKASMRHYASLSRQEIRDTFAAFCNARPVGAKFAHRATDRPARSSPSMKWVNPPVAYMMHAGVPLLIDAGLHLPGLLDGDESRVAVEAYPGLLARELIGSRSYKADDKARQTPEREAARTAIVDALCLGRVSLGLRLHASPRQRRELIVDASGDRLDAVLCLMQAGWARGRPLHGMPPDADPLEGWIASAAFPIPA